MDSVQACPRLGMSHLDGLGRLAPCLHVIAHVKMYVCVPYQQQVRVILHVLLVTIVLLYQWQMRT